MKTVIQTSARTVAERIETAAYDAALHNMKGWESASNASQTMALAMASLKGSAVPSGDLFTSKQKGEFIGRGFKRALEEYTA